MHGSAKFIERASLVDEKFRLSLSSSEATKSSSTAELSDFDLPKQRWIAMFESQLLSRQLDFAALRLKNEGKSYYTIGSSGHEGNAVVAEYFQLKDMAFLHYRSGAFMVQRARKLPEIDAIKNHILALMAAKSDPIAQGRHKVFGSLALNVPPQTSTIASHLPKALGAAYAVRLAKDLSVPNSDEIDSLVLCSFGDASLNHASAQTAINSAQYIAKSSYPLPLIFICEDNGLGISVPTPTDWVKQTMSQRPYIHYIAVDGLNMASLWGGCIEAEYYARKKHQPVFLHVKTVRLLGHAGADIEVNYRSIADIESDEALDPLVQSARLLMHSRYMNPAQIIQLYELAEQRVINTCEQLSTEVQLQTSMDVLASLTPIPKHKSAPPRPNQQQRQAVFAQQYKLLSQPRSLSQLINAGLTDLMLQYPSMVVFGEDVARKGGVYNVTADLLKRFGPKKVTDTVLDETVILGTALGFACKNLLPVPEIQFLAYTHNAVDQIRGEAATLSFFSSGQFANPMIIRIASLAYQKGFGGHFHNENAIAFLREIPGLIIACPSSGVDAVKMLRTLAKQAYCFGRVTVLLEPIALYSVKDLHHVGDKQWLGVYPDPSLSIELGDIAVSTQLPVTKKASKALTIISYGNGYYHCCAATKILVDSYQLAVKLIDLRWLAPLPEEQLLKTIDGDNHVLIVDECRKTGSLSEGLVTLMVENCQSMPKVARLTAEDCFITLGDSWQSLLPSRDDIVARALLLVDSG